MKGPAGLTSASVRELLSRLISQVISAAPVSGAAGRGLRLAATQVRQLFFLTAPINGPAGRSIAEVQLPRPRSESGVSPQPQVLPANEPGGLQLHTRGLQGGTSRLTNGGARDPAAGAKCHFSAQSWQGLGGSDGFRRGGGGGGTLFLLRTEGLVGRSRRKAGPSLHGARENRAVRSRPPPPGDLSCSRRQAGTPPPGSGTRSGHGQRLGRVWAPPGARSRRPPQPTSRPPTRGWGGVKTTPEGHGEPHGHHHQGHPAVLGGKALVEIGPDLEESRKR